MKLKLVDLMMSFLPFYLKNVQDTSTNFVKLFTNIRGSLIRIQYLKPRYDPFSFSLISSLPLKELSFNFYYVKAQCKNAYGHLKFVSNNVLNHVSLGLSCASMKCTHLIFPAMLFCCCGLTLHMSCDIRKPNFCICENKDADQLRGNREADQRFCFRYKDSIIPLLPTSEISSL